MAGRRGLSNMPRHIHFALLALAAAAPCLSQVPPAIHVVAHRGAMRWAPENTLPAFHKAIAMGADVIEMDVRQTLDGHFVIMHDESVDRTTDGEGLVRDLTLEQIRKLSAHGERVPTLEEALDAIQGRALPDIDLKAGDPRKLAAVLKRRNLLRQATVHGRNWRTLSAGGQFIVRADLPVGRSGLAELLGENWPAIISLDAARFSEQIIHEIHRSGRKAYVSTVGVFDHEAGIRRVLESGADYIESDRPDLVAAIVAQKSN